MTLLTGSPRYSAGTKAKRTEADGVHANAAEDEERWLQDDCDLPAASSEYPASSPGAH